MRKYFKKQDIIVIIILLFVSFVGMWSKFKSFYPTKTAQVFVNNQLTLEISLDKPQVYSLEQNPNVQIEVSENNKVAIIKSDCYDKICVRTGEIHRSGEIVVCLPNRIVLSIPTDETDNSVDSVA